MFIRRFREDWSSPRKTDQQRFLFCKLACPFKTAPTTVAGMTTFIKISSLVFALLATMSLRLEAGTPEQEKAFVDKYKTAFEGKIPHRWNHSSTHKAPTQRLSVFTK
jgi:hypothetical protein